MGTPITGQTIFTRRLTGTRPNRTRHFPRCRRRQNAFRRCFVSAGRERRQRVEFDMTYVFERELRLLLERNGLKVERIFGNYDGSPVRPNSPRLIARCCPAEGKNLT